VSEIVAEPVAVNDDPLSVEIVIAPFAAAPAPLSDNVVVSDATTNDVVDAKLDVVPLTA